MKIPIKKNENKIIIDISKKLYTAESINKAMDEYSGIVKKVQSQDSRIYQKVEFKSDKLKDALEWANYLFYLNR